MTTPAAIFDALIIGAGPAGLSVATGLARQLHTAVVFNTGVFRNAKTRHMHNVLGWDHRDPAEFRAQGRNDLLARYSTIRFLDVGIEAVFKGPDGRFEARDVNGQSWKGKKLVLATGVKDVFPDIDGYADCWGQSIFHCLFCDGYEERGAESAGVLATDLLGTTHRATHGIRMAKRLTKQVSVYTNGDNEWASTLQSLIAGDDGFKIDSRPIARLENSQTGAGIVIYFKDGSHVKEAFLAHAPNYVVNGPFIENLGLEKTETGDIKVSPMFNETSMSGVFAVGDCANPMKAVTPSISMGTGTAGAIVMQLQGEK
ncbi:hypothetical protein UA08_06434 [Talaromyces atroroseus]|uniref:FAD/NAD(P)-binding domain-containing protein n=1 Tax=Talaromyces atroroseus TaxID=1441469 RepID=A0A225AXA2_TALAT|nr:hypothetical protein UA08_06434 [Talaromyces atroroseus]OKL58127.1 hypothetical protein UA08_06434 [Talaromyces atroroseus]